MCFFVHRWYYLVCFPQIFHCHCYSNLDQCIIIIVPMMENLRERNLYPLDGWGSWVIMYLIYPPFSSIAKTHKLCYKTVLIEGTIRPVFIHLYYFIQSVNETTSIYDGCLLDDLRLCGRPGSMVQCLFVIVCLDYSKCKVWSLCRHKDKQATVVCLNKTDVVDDVVWEGSSHLTLFV